MLEFSWWSRWQAIWESSICVPELTVAPNVLESQLMMERCCDKLEAEPALLDMAGNVCASLLLRLRQLISGNLMEPLAWTRYCSSHDGIMSYPKWTSSSTLHKWRCYPSISCGNLILLIQWRSKLQLDGPSKLHAQVGAMLTSHEKTHHVGKSQVSLKCSGLGSRAHAERQRWKSKDTCQKNDVFYRCVFRVLWCHIDVTKVQKRYTWWQLTQYLATLFCGSWSCQFGESESTWSFYCYSARRAHVCRVFFWFWTKVIVFYLTTEHIFMQFKTFSVL